MHSAAATIRGISLIVEILCEASAFTVRSMGVEEYIVPVEYIQYRETVVGALCIL